LNLVSCFCIKNDDRGIFYGSFRKRYQIESPVYNETNKSLMTDRDRRMCRTFENNYASAEVVNYAAS